MDSNNKHNQQGASRIFSLTVAAKTVQTHSSSQIDRYMLGFLGGFLNSCRMFRFDCNLFTVVLTFFKSNAIDSMVWSLVHVDCQAFKKPFHLDVFNLNLKSFFNLSNYRSRKSYIRQVSNTNDTAKKASLQMTIFFILSNQELVAQMK